MSVAYISLGSNVGDRKENIVTAISNLKTVGDVQKVSAIYETEPYGFKAQDEFLNCVAKISTKMAPDALLERLLNIEAGMGRVRVVRWGPRTIDLDILMFDDIVCNSDFLTLPHKDMHNRIFILKPLLEIEPGLVHPALRTPISMLYEKLLKETEKEFKCAIFKG